MLFIVRVWYKKSINWTFIDSLFKNRTGYGQMPEETTTNEASDSIDWYSVSQSLNNYLTENRVSVDQLAAEVGVTRRTLDRIRNGGKGRMNTLKKIEEFLGERFSLEYSNEPSQPNLTTGGYTKEDTEKFIGGYYTFRYSFDYPDGIVCGYTDIFWDENIGGLAFNEIQKNKSREGSHHKYDFKGVVAIPKDTNIMYLTFESGGFRRLTTLQTLSSTPGEKLRGLILAINLHEDIAYYPVSSPVVYFRDREKETIPSRIGSYNDSDVWDKRALEELKKLENRCMPKRIRSF